MKSAKQTPSDLIMYQVVQFVKRLLEVQYLKGLTFIQVSLSLSLSLSLRLSSNVFLACACKSLSPSLSRVFLSFSNGNGKFLADRRLSR